MFTRRSCLALGGSAAFSLVPGLALAKAPARDRQSILAMLGDYRVRFDMRETVALTQGYTLLQPKLSGGYECVRLIEDQGDFISLQHMLVADNAGKPMVIKHWRQDWSFEPAQVLEYDKLSTWKLQQVPAAARKGAWSQTVWQTDDSPRYGGVGRWSYEGGAASWKSDETLRPLARRDAVRKPVYAWYAGWNRHTLTPTGWVHEQDNTKLGFRDGKPLAYVHETVLNTYDRFSGFPAKAADDYWAHTKDYWAGVRAAWDRTIAKDRGVVVTEEAQNGSITGPKLMDLADQIDEGKTTTTAAIIEARTIIAGPERTKALASLP